MTKLLERFYERELQKTNQTEFKSEKNNKENI